MSSAQPRVRCCGQQAHRRHEQPARRDRRRGDRRRHAARGRGERRRTQILQLLRGRRRECVAPPARRARRAEPRPRPRLAAPPTPPAASSPSQRTAQLEEAFHLFTNRKDIAILIINQYVAATHPRHDRRARQASKGTRTSSGRRKREGAAAQPSGRRRALWSADAEGDSATVTRPSRSSWRCECE